MLKQILFQNDFFLIKFEKNILIKIKIPKKNRN